MELGLASFIRRWDRVGQPHEKTLSVISKASGPESRITPMAPPAGVARAQIVSSDIIKIMTNN